MAVLGQKSVVSATFVKSRLEEFEGDGSSMRLLEVDLDPGRYYERHPPGALALDWAADLARHGGRDVVSRAEFEALLGELGVEPESTVVLYGDRGNLLAAHAYWLFAYYGHDDVYLMDGGRDRWLEHDYPTTAAVPSVSGRDYEASAPDESIRACYADVAARIKTGGTVVDVCPPENRQRSASVVAEAGGHVPGAESVHWERALDASGQFRSRERLRELYSDVDDNGAVTFCRSGIHASLTWFVLHELLGMDVANYVGSWLEWPSRGAVATLHGE